MAGKPGRPSKRTAQLVDEICERLSRGEPLAAICRDDRMPHPSTVRDWMTADPEVSRAIARAREDGFDAIAARVRLTARGKGEDQGGDSLGDVQRDKLIIETDLKLLAKWDPKRYGEMLKQELSGPNGGPVPIQAIERRIIDPANPDA